MGTSNFGRVNLCSSIWSFWTEEEPTSEFEYDDTIENVSQGLFEIDGVSLCPHNPNALAYFNISYFDKKERYWEDNVYYIFVEGWYYEGARFDICEDSSSYFNEDAKKIASYNKKVQKKIKEIEKVFERYTIPLVKIAQFSNGETIYERAGSIEH